VFGAPIEWPMLRDILRVGALACLSPLQSVCSILLVTRLVASFGTEALAGYGIGVRLEFLLAPIAFAIGIACVPLVGMAVGAGDAMRARGVAWTAGALAASLVGSAGILVAVFPGAWAALFTRDAAVLSSSASYFAWAGPGYAFFGLGMCLYFGAQGAGHVLGPVLAQTVRLLIIAAGGWWLTRIGAPAWQMFALVSFAMVAYGLAAAFAVYRVPWGALRKI